MRGHADARAALRWSSRGTRASAATSTSSGSPRTDDATGRGARLLRKKPAKTANTRRANATTNARSRRHQASRGAGVAASCSARSSAKNLATGSASGGARRGRPATVVGSRSRTAASLARASVTFRKSLDDAGAHSDRNVATDASGATGGEKRSSSSLSGSSSA
jgi:hypothetical protein